MSVTEQDLESKREQIASLRQEISQEGSKRAEVLASKERVLEAGRLDQEIERLQRELKVEKSATASTAGIVTGDGLAEVPAPVIPPTETTDEGSTEAEPAPAVDAESVPPASTPASAPAGRGIFGGGK